MLFAPVYGGCYIISNVAIEYSCGLSVMWCILSIRFECSGRVTDAFQKKKKKLDRGVGGWVELYPIFFGLSDFF